MNKIAKIADNKLFQWMKEIRRTLHRLPELAFKEEKTSRYISQLLDQIGVDHKRGIARTGIVGDLIINRKAPTIALRADMDALPVHEATGLPFSSETPGTMHACGHDGHVAMLLGAAALLKKYPPEGNVRFIFQPAEESVGGAQPMIDQGALKGVDMIFGGHIETHHIAGEIGIKAGIHTAYTDAFEIRVTGRGGHAARPHETVDAVLVSSLLVLEFQTIVSRNVDPVQPVVITIGQITAGTVNNAIAEKAILKGTIRTTDEAVRNQVIGKMKKTISAFASLHGARIRFVVHPGYPPIMNEERAYSYARHVAEEMLGNKNVISIPFPGLGGEDFAYYLQEVPGCFVRVGGGFRRKENFPSHSPRFDFDEEALRVGAAYLSELVRYSVRELRRGKK